MGKPVDFRVDDNLHVWLTGYSGYRSYQLTSGNKKRKKNYFSCILRELQELENHCRHHIALSQAIQAHSTLRFLYS